MAEEEENEPADIKVVGNKVKVGGDKKKPPILLILIFIINSGFNGTIAYLFYKNNQAQKNKETVQDIVDSMKASDDEDAMDEMNEADALLDIVLRPIDTFVVNLSGDGGARYIKIDMELELSNGDVSDELEKRKPQIRDIIITLLSSKTYEQIDSSEDKEFLREEVKNTINGFLVKGKVLKVYFSQFIVT